MSLVVTEVNVKVQAVVLAVPDWEPASVCVVSEPKQLYQWGAAVPKVIVTVDAPVVPVQVKLPALIPPTGVPLVAHAPVPVNVGNVPPA